MLGLYLHIPFCVRRCHYCAFPVTTVIDAAQQERYVTRLLADIKNGLAQLDHPPLSTLYIGGGTPTLLAPRYWEQIFSLLDPLLPQCQEITVETNPESTTPEIMQLLKSLGVTRVSLGVQSTNAALLRRLGRQHTADDILRALDTIFRAGFSNVSTDLILGLPGDDHQEYLESLRTLLTYPITHVSGYFLMIKEGSAFARSLPALPDEEYTLDSYLAVHELLERHGFARYEVSNWAKPGFECLHNVHTWQHRPYLGIGMGAESYVSERRFVHPLTFEEYLDTPFPTIAALPEQSLEDQYSEAVLLNLRLREGIHAESLMERFPDYALLFQQRSEELHTEGLLETKNHRITTTDQGLFVLDYVTSHLLP